LPGWSERPISEAHNRTVFDCGDEALNVFLRQYARQNHERGGAKTFVATPKDSGSRILGFYSLRSASIAYARVPALVKRGLARHDVPVFRLARLAVDLAAQGQGLGGELLLSASRRCLLAAAEVGGAALLIDAKSERIAAWYASFGAILLLDEPRSLVLPLAIVEVALLMAEGR
jgi:GNAT superfamily N-acetyltransferase